MVSLKIGNIHAQLTVALLLKLTLFIGACFAAYQGRYQATVEILIIIFITFLPVILGRRFDVKIPHEFELIAVIFIYASLFLGEVHGYYLRFWWWDVVLHTGSGFLLGIVGFLLVYVLNEKKEIHLHMKPGFVALFAFVFAVALGGIWEVFEFTMDQLFGLNMQKSGLVDTMWDLIVDTIGALTISMLGYGYLTTAGTSSFLEKWIENFIEKNPRFFSG